MTNGQCPHSGCTDGSELGQYCRVHAVMHPYALVDLVDTLAGNLRTVLMREAALTREYEPVVRDGESYWQCLIGPASPDDLPGGCDAPMRRAVDDAFTSITGRIAKHCASGWGASPDAMQREVMDELDAKS